MKQEIKGGWFEVEFFSGWDGAFWAEDDYSSFYQYAKGRGYQVEGSIDTRPGNRERDFWVSTCTVSVWVEPFTQKRVNTLSEKAQNYSSYHYHTTS